MCRGGGRHSVRTCLKRAFGRSNVHFAGKAAKRYLPSDLCDWDSASCEAGDSAAMASGQLRRLSIRAPVGVSREPMEPDCKAQQKSRISTAPPANPGGAFLCPAASIYRDTKAPLRKMHGCATIWPMLTKRKKQKVIKETAIHDTDTGSPEVQIAILSKKIDELTTHLKKHLKDKHSRRGLLQMVADRRAHLKYLEGSDKKRYNAILKKLDLKK